MAREEPHIGMSLIRFTLFEKSRIYCESTRKPWGAGDKLSEDWNKYSNLGRGTWKKSNGQSTEKRGDSDAIVRTHLLYGTAQGAEPRKETGRTQRLLVQGI